MRRKRRLLVTALLFALVAAALWYEPPDATESAADRIMDEVQNTPVLQMSEGPLLRGKGPHVVEVAEAPVSNGSTVLVQDDEARTPIPAALVGLIQANSPSLEDEDSIHLQDTVEIVARTGEDGKAVIARSEEAQQNVVAVAVGYLPAVTTVAAGASDTVIYLQRGAFIHGRVVSSDGTPVAGAVVRAVRPGVAPCWPHSVPRLAAIPGGGGNRAVTGEGGVFALSGLLPGTSYEVLVKAPGHSQGLDAPLLVRAPSEDLVITLVPQCLIRLRFVDDATGEPITPAPDVFFIGGGAADPRELDDLAKGELAFSFVPYERGGKHETPSECGLVLRRLGYKRVVNRIGLPWRRSASAEIRLTRTSPRFTSLRLTAGFPDGARYDGVLTVTLADGQDSMASDFTFVDGRATRTVEVPPGRITLSTPGGRGAVDWYWKALREPVAANIIARPGEQVVDLELRGQPVRLQVTDKQGSQYRTYDVLARVSRGYEVSSGWYRGWAAVARHALTRTADDRNAAPIALWLPPGENAVQVNVPEVGSGSVVVQVGTNGVPTEARVQLTAPAVDYRRRPSRESK